MLTALCEIVLGSSGARSDSMSESIRSGWHSSSEFEGRRTRRSFAGGASVSGWLEGGCSVSLSELSRKGVVSGSVLDSEGRSSASEVDVR